MRIVVFNAGSSSLKFGVFDHQGAATVQVFKGAFERFRDGGCQARFEAGTRRESGAAPYPDLAAATAAVPGVLADWGLDGLDAVGHRIAHGGADFAQPALLDDATLARIEALTPLAPLHNPANLEAVRVARKVWPDLPQVGVFDTAFHLTNPPRVTTYAVPGAWRDAGLRRYGFHGTSHKYVARRAAEALDRPLGDLRLISVHLGNGASACAVNLGRSLESSMGLTPLEGLVMGTRSGDIDPGAFGWHDILVFMLCYNVSDLEQTRAGIKPWRGLAAAGPHAGLCAAAGLRYPATARTHPTRRACRSGNSHDGRRGQPF